MLITIPNEQELRKRLRDFPPNFVTYFANRFAGWDRLSVNGFVVDIVIVTILIKFPHPDEAEQVRNLRELGTKLVEKLVDDPDLKSQSLRHLNNWLNECQ